MTHTQGRNFSDGDLDIVKQDIRALEPALEAADNQMFRTAVVLLSAVSLECSDAATLCLFTRYPEAFVARIETNMRKAGLWRDDDLDVELLLTKTERGRAAINAEVFWVHVLVARGELQTRRRKDGKLEFSKREVRTQ